MKNCNCLLQVKDINKEFNGIKAVDNCSFEVYEGEIMGLLGPNGAGKTTIIRMIMDIIGPDSGKIKFKGSNNIDKKKLGYLPEERGIYSDTKVLDTILYFAELNNWERKKAKAEALRWLEKLELEAYKNKKVEELSKGMQQKIQFIISMIHQPRLLVLDELFSGLDPVNQDLFKKIVEELVYSGITILLSSHRMNMVEELCDRIFLINKGKRVLYGHLEDIKRNFGLKTVRIKTTEGIKELSKNPYVKNLEESENKLKFNIGREIRIPDFLNSLPPSLEMEEISITDPSLHSIFVNTVREEG